MEASADLSHRPSDNHVPTGEETRPPKRPPPGNSLLNGRFGSQRLEASPIRQRYEMGTPHQTMNNYHTAFGRFEERHSVFTDDTLQGSSSDLQDSQLALGRKKGKQMRGRKFLQPHFPEHLTTDKFNNRTDPYEADAEATMYFLELFFHHRNSSPYVIWPRNRFFEWTRNCKTKSIDDLMILYALMALGTIFSQEPGTNEIGDKCYDIAYSLERERANQPSLQMMQARGALLLFNFARGNFEGTFEYTAHAIRTATSMRYTDENRVADIDETVTKYDFDMNAAQIKECRRRSFYITYFIDVSLSLFSRRLKPSYLRVSSDTTAFRMGPWVKFTTLSSFCGYHPMRMIMKKVARSRQPLSVVRMFEKRMSLSRRQWLSSSRLRPFGVT